MDSSARPPEQEVARVAPSVLPNARTSRYMGDTVSVRLADLPPGDRERVVRLYDALVALLAGVRDALALHEPPQEQPAMASPAPSGDRSDVGDAIVLLARTARDPGWRSVIAAAQRIGTRDSAGSAPASPMVQHSLHDVRGGALAALVITLDLIAATGGGPSDPVRAFYLVRDHLKIMRNAIEDLDVAGRARDTRERLHGSRLLADKWQDAVHRLSDAKNAHVSLSLRYDGPVSRRCLEFAALDRVLYNMMNNAARFAADGEILLDISAVGVPGHQNLRVAIANAVTDAQAVALAPLADRDGTLARLFDGGFTIGGEGVGMRLCAEIVAQAYGLGDARTAAELRHVGAVIRGLDFVGWFHWPLDI